MKIDEIHFFAIKAEKGFVLTEKETHEVYCMAVQIPYEKGVDNWEEISEEQYLLECKEKNILPNNSLFQK